MLPWCLCRVVLPLNLCKKGFSGTGAAACGIPNANRKGEESKQDECAPKTHLRSCSIVIKRRAGKREILHISRRAADDTGKREGLADPEWCFAPATPSQVRGRCRSSQPLQVLSLRRTVVEQRWVLHSVFWYPVRWFIFLLMTGFQKCCTKSGTR